MKFGTLQRRVGRGMADYADWADRISSEINTAKGAKGDTGTAV